MPRRLATLLAGTVAAVLMAACASGDSNVSVGGTVVTSTTTTASSSSTPPPTTGPPATTTTPTSAATATTVPVAKLTWTPCGEGLDCSTLTVPMDYSDPAKGSVALYVKRHKATKPSARIGTLLAHPGGPGIPATSLVDQVQFYFSKDLLAAFDVVAFDARGSGRSSAIDCVSDLDPYFGIDPTPDTPKEKDELVAHSKELADRCAQKSGALLPYVSTANTARDMDALRAALGEEKISFFGFSYGSVLGAVYATMFPQHVRAMVVDGAGNPNASELEQAKESAVGLERSLDTALDQCAKDTSCPFHHSGKPGPAFDALMASLDAKPLQVSAGRPTVGQGVAYYAVISTLYGEEYWPSLMQALADAERGNGKSMLQLYDDYLQRSAGGAWTNVYEDLLAVDCLDERGATTVEGVDALADQVAPLAPRLGRWAATSYFCAFWVPPADPLPTVTGRGAGPIVVVGTTGDPVTPIESSKALAESLEQGVLVTVEAQQHTGYGANQCTIDTIDPYLLRLRVPPAGTVCK